METIEKLDTKPMAAAHLDYPDIWENGLKSYPFARSRIDPVIYEITDGAKVLDVGCNSGEFIKYLRDEKGCDVYGLDISQPMVELCHKKGLPNVVLGDADKIPFMDETFDYVTLMEVLEHFDDPVKCLKEISRVLKKDGILIGTCPHKNLEAHIWSDERLHQQYYDELGLKNDLYQAFKDVHLRVLNGMQYNLAWANSFLATLPCEMLFKAGKSICEPWDEQLRKIKKVRVWWGFTQLAGVCYYRMRGFAEKMDKFGVESAFENFKYDGFDLQTKWQEKMSGSFIPKELERLIEIADLSVWQIISSNFALAFLMSAAYGFGKKIVTEIDDWIFDLPSYNIASNPYKPNSGPEFTAYEQLKLSSSIVCSTQFLKDQLRQMFPDKKIYVVPNSIDFDLWDPPVTDEPDLYKKEPGIIRIGYSGCGNHEGDLEIIKRPLKKLMEEFPNLELLTYHHFKALEELPRVVYTNKWIPINQFPDEMKRWNLDIGIAPLRDNNFNRAKSNLRWLEYSALKVPTVMSDVYPFTNSVRNGKTGILCSNSDLSWYESMKQLITDKGKRIAMGKAAYKDVKTRFNMDSIAKKYAGILKEIKCKGPSLKQKSVTSSETQTMTDGQPVSSAHA